MLLGTIITIGAAVAFAAIALGVIVGIPYTIRTRMASRFRITHAPVYTRVGSIVYVLCAAALPTLLALLTTYELWQMLSRIWD